jgi:hypothetical protein
VFDHIEGHHGVEAAGREGNPREVGAHESVEALLSAHEQACPRAIGAEAGAIAGQVAQDTAGAAAQIEQSPARRVAVGKRSEQEPLAHEPPVIVLDPIQQLELGVVHGRSAWTSRKGSRGPARRERSIRASRRRAADERLKTCGGKKPSCSTRQSMSPAARYAGAPAR